MKVNVWEIFNYLYVIQKRQNRALFVAEKP